MMTQTETFTMRISPYERAILADLAQHLNRSQSDTLRAIMREVWSAMKDEEIAASSQPTPVIKPE
jgi:hypothetical protein